MGLRETPEMALKGVWEGVMDGAILIEIISSGENLDMKNKRSLTHPKM